MRVVFGILGIIIVLILLLWPYGDKMSPGDVEEYEDMFGDKPDSSKPNK